MTERMTYDVEAIRSGGWWALRVPTVPGVHSQVRRLHDADDMARDAISLALDVPAESFDVYVIPYINDETNRAIKAAKEAQVAAAELRPKMLEAIRLAVAAGVTVRDIADQLDVSFQYVSKLAAQHETVGTSPPPAERPAGRTAVR